MCHTSACFVDGAGPMLDAVQSYNEISIRIATHVSLFAPQIRKETFIAPYELERLVADIDRLEPRNGAAYCMISSATGRSVGRTDVILSTPRTRVHLQLGEKS